MAHGLAPLHEKGIVHRDIKPANIIVKADDSATKRPVLIDFGLAYVESEPRLSNVNETVGNVRFSPDVAMYRMDNVPPWLDVHNLAQLFMWMTQLRPDKNWSRALDPRWVSYDTRLSQDSILSIRALTASCSEQSISPKNAQELITLIDQLFLKTISKLGLGIDISGIEEGKRRGLATAQVAKAQDARITEASFPIIAKTYLALREQLDSLFVQFNASGILVDKAFDRKVDNFRGELLETKNTTTDMLLSRWAVGDDTGTALTFQISIQGLVPSRRSEFWGGAEPIDLGNPFFFHLYFERPEGRTRGVFPHKARLLNVNDQGLLFLRDTIHTPATPTSISSVVEMVKQWIQDPEVWEALHKFQ